MKYVMLICGDPALWENLPEEDTKQAYAAIDVFITKWKERGKWANLGAELDSPATARTIRRNGSGGAIVTDGPYTDIKEIVGGFMTIEADDIDEAVAIASEWPGIASGDAVEVRPVINT